ncbi:hypothetical protein LR48_Vigan07g256400 [Vigna angularis]|uniref:Glycosyl hydrolase family 32 N-terminal domain-containing protein n=1 Tax=Phaseolus angularis TaxID=3914 RepID=A0A0L9V148_PHAAN|nr:hypothetical protein LR48_Vigan07g256400 [Vigna angularis]
MYYKGVYHFFYQFNPYAPTFGRHMVWGHSVSYDLINWIHLNHALEPSESYDINGCYSGSITILPGEKPIIMYTGSDSNKHQVQNLAVPKNLSDPFLREWEKHPQNPILIPPSGVEVDGFRDPTTALQGSDGKWRVIIGAKNGDEGKALLYYSEDFVHWKLFPNPMYASENTGMFECPDFFPVYISGTKNGVDTSVHNSSVKHVLKTSYQNKQLEYYFLGDYFLDQEKFVADADLGGPNLNLILDHGMFYASKSFFDYAKNRRILWGWSKECDTTQDDYEKGWAGLQSIPRQVWLHTNGKMLMQWPIEEVEKLRENQISIKGEKLVGGSSLEVSGITASQADVEVLFELPELENAEFLDESEVDPHLLSSLREKLYKPSYGTIFDIDPNQKTISLRSLIDRSIVESFGEKGKICITSRVYPSLAIDKDAHLFAFNNGRQSVVISELNAWSMKHAEFGQEESIK